MSVTYEETTAPCPTCKRPAKHITTDFNGTKLDPLPFCVPCGAKIESEGMKRAREQEEAKLAALNYRRLTAWDIACPGGYQEINLEPTRGAPHLKNERLKAYLAKYEAGQSAGFAGTSREGKTRVAYQCLKRCYEAGTTVMALSHPDLVKIARDASRGDKWAENQLEDIKHCGALLIDDIGKGADTPRGLEALWNIVNHRTTRKLPLIWTANGGDQYLTNKLGDEFGKPIVERLRESTNPISV